MSSNSKCFVPGCSSGYASEKKKNEKTGIKNPSLFTVPKNNQEMLAIWNRAIPRQDRKLTFKDRVCENHFEDHFLEYYFRTVLPDGSIHFIKRDRPKLLDGAIPSKFAKCLPYLPEKIIKKQKASAVKEQQNCINV